MPKHTKEELLGFLETVDKNPTYYKNNNTDIYMAVIKRFGSWENGMKESGKDYYSSLNHKGWTNEQMEDIIANRIKLGRSVNQRHLYFYYPGLLRAIKSEYGSLENIIEKSGIKYNHVKKTRKWKRDNIVFEILSAERKGIDISSVGLNVYDSGLHFAVNEVEDIITSLTKNVS